MSVRRFVAPDSVVETYEQVSSHAEANEYGNGKVIAGLTGEGEVLTFIVGNEGERYGGDISRVRPSKFWCQTNIFKWQRLCSS